MSPRSLDKMLLKLQVNPQNVQNIQLSKFFTFSRSSKFLVLKIQSGLVPHELIIDANWQDSYDFQTSLNLFRFNMIRIVTIHTILKHV